MGVFPCGLCNKIFPYEKRLREHLSVHGIKRDYLVNQKIAEWKKASIIPTIQAPEELKECCFKPSVIGYDYDNSGLTRTEKQFYGVDGARDSQSVKEKSVERRCHEWLQNKEKNQLIREL